MAQKLDEKALANAFAIVVAISYIICIVLLWISPSFAVTLGNYLSHGVDISSIIVVRNAGYSLISLILGTISAWLFGYIFAKIYNKIAK